jgi:ribosomal protein S18 acetylase RimI-like enzyme
MIRLREKSDDDLTVWLEVLWDDYEKDLIDSGLSREAAAANIARNRSQLFVDGEPVEGQFFFDVVRDELKVGSLWLSHQPDRSPHEWFIYDVVVDEAYRGQGLGRATMQAAEEFARSRGGTRLALNVFGPNTVARRLYESMDYQTQSIQMFKDLA